jgi:hypothetical protein
VVCKQIIAGRELAIKHLGSNLPRKFNRWTEDYAEEIQYLLLSIFHKVDRNRISNYVAFISMDEVKNGFRVLLAMEVLIESLPKDLMQDVRKRYSDFSKVNGDAHCTVMFSVKDVKTGETSVTDRQFGMGEDSILPALQEIADGLKKEEFIKEFNKESKDGK